MITYLPLTKWFGIQFTFSKWNKYKNFPNGFKIEKGHAYISKKQKFLGHIGESIEKGISIKLYTLYVAIHIRQNINFW